MIPPINMLKNQDQRVLDLERHLQADEHHGQAQTLEHDFPDIFRETLAQYQAGQRANDHGHHIGQSSDRQHVSVNPNPVIDIKFNAPLCEKGFFQARLNPSADAQTIF